jgi:hypothetical protein
MNAKLTEPQRRALRDLLTYRGRHLAVYHRHQTLQALVRRGLANPQGQGHGHTITDAGVRWMVESGEAAPEDIVELAHALALREDEARTPAPVVVAAKVVMPTPEQRHEQIRAEYRDREAARLQAALRDGMVAIVRTVEALTPALLQFARDASSVAAELARLLGTPHPNACSLCGLGEGKRDHGGGHDYRPPVDVIRLRRMQLRRSAGQPERQRVHAAHVEYRREVNLRLLRERLEAEGSHWTEPPTELERAGLTEVPFDQQGGNPDEWKQGEKHGNVVPDASAYSLSS